MVVSDLHMSTPDGPVPDPFADDEAFAALIASLTSDGVPTCLIRLGDMLDLVLGLSAEVLLELDRRATPTLLTIARRMVWSAAAGTRSAGSSVPALGARRSASLPEPGTWSSMVRRGRDRDRDRDEDRLRFVELEHGGNRPPIARLQRWDGDRMVVRLAAR